MKINEIINVKDADKTYDHLVDSETVPETYEAYKILAQDTENLTLPKEQLFTSDEIKWSIDWTNDSINKLNGHIIKPTQAIDILYDIKEYFERY